MLIFTSFEVRARVQNAIFKIQIHYLIVAQLKTNIPQMKGTVPKRLPGTFSVKILALSFHSTLFFYIVLRHLV